MNGYPGQFLAEGYPTGEQSRNPQIVVSINTANALSSAGVTRILATQVSHEPLGPIRSMTFGNNATMSPSSNGRYEPNVLASGPVSLA